MRLLKTGSEVLAARIGQVVCGAVSGVIVARVLGAEGQGRYSLSLAVAMLAAALLNGGIGLAAVPLLRRGELPLIWVLRAQMGWVAAAATLLFVLSLPLTVWRPDWSVVHLGWTGGLALLVALGAAALIAFDIGVYNLLAAGRLLAGTALNFGRAVCQLVCLAALASAGRLDLDAALCVYSVTQLGAALVLLRMLGRQKGVTAAGGPLGGTATVSAAAVDRPAAIAWRLVRTGAPGQFSAVASLLYLRLNLALLTAWHGPSAAGIYSVAALVAELLWHLPASLSPLLVYSSADPVAPRARDERAARAVHLSVVTTAGAAVLLVVAAPRLLPRVCGQEYTGAVAPLLALLPGTVVYAAGAVLAGDFIGRGRPSWNAQASLLTLAVNLVAAVLLIPRAGAIGAAWAATAAYTVGGAWMVVRFRRATGLAWRQLLLPAPARFFGHRSS